MRYRVWDTLYKEYKCDEKRYMLSQNGEIYYIGDKEVTNAYECKPEFEVDLGLSVPAFENDIIVANSKDGKEIKIKVSKSISKKTFKKFGLSEKDFRIVGTIHDK